MRTVEQIRERLKTTATTNDPLGMAIDDLRCYLPEELKEGLTPSPPPTQEEMKKQIAEYLSFAFEKAIDHRGLSANRSVLHMANWAWLGELDELVAFIEDDSHYPSYGVPVLKRCAREVGVALPSEIERWLDGEPCEPGCQRGCRE